MRLLLVTGEPCPQRLVEKWAGPGRRMLNVYGFTEAIVNASTAELEPGKPVTIGHPLPSYEAHILDDQLRPVAAGQTGELCIAGPTVARGYFKRPEHTAERFVANPFDKTEPHRRLYRSGDLVRVNDDGELETLGRIDGQVKIRGFRTELSEIEAVLLEHPTVRAAAVNKVVDHEGVEKLAAYVVPVPSEGPFDQEGVLDLLSARLPDYMLPGYFDLVDEIPTTTIGKVDRTRLPEPKHELPPLSGRDSRGQPVVTTPASWVTARSGKGEVWRFAQSGGIVLGAVGPLAQFSSASGNAILFTAGTSNHDGHFWRQLPHSPLWTWVPGQQLGRQQTERLNHQAPPSLRSVCLPRVFIVAQSLPPDLQQLAQQFLEL